MSFFLSFNREQKNICGTKPQEFKVQFVEQE